MSHENDVVFLLEMKVTSQETAEAVKRLVDQITALLEGEDRDGFHLYRMFIRWPLISKYL